MHEYIFFFKSHGTDVDASIHAHILLRTNTHNPTLMRTFEDWADKFSKLMKSPMTPLYISTGTSPTIERLAIGRATPRVPLLLLPKQYLGRKTQKYNLQQLP
jgi:hypothetical protein